MLDVTVKTLDGQNRSFSVRDDITVRQFKEKIAGSIDISADSQRLIFQGRVLQDDKNLNDYDVNGKTLHVVQRPPPSVRQSNAGAAESSSGATDRPEMRTFVRSFALPSDIADPNEVQNIVQNVLAGMGDVGQNARISTSSSSDGSSVDVRINLGQINPGTQGQLEAQNRIRIAQRMINRARAVIALLENPNAEEEDAMDVTPSEESTLSRQAESGSPGTSAASGQSAAAAADAKKESESTNVDSGMPSQVTAQSGPSNETSDQADRQESPSSEDTRSPHTSALSELLHDVFEINARLQPHMVRYQHLMEQDPSFENDSDAARSAQRLCDMVPQAMHYISHVYHNISDLMVDIQQERPRLLRSNPVAQQVAIVQQTIPIQAQISVSSISPRGSPLLPRRSTTSSASRTTPASVATAASSAQASATATSAPRMSTQANIRMHGAPLRFTRAVGMVPPVLSTNRSRPPFMMMDIRPQSIHINSVTAQVVRNSTVASTNATSTSTNASSSTTSGPASTTQTPSSTASSSGGTQMSFQMPAGIFAGGPVPLSAEHMPPRIMESIMQMAAQSAMEGLGGQPQVIVISQDGMVSGSSTLSTATSSSTTGTASTSSGQAAPSGSSQQPQTQASSTQTSATTATTMTTPSSQPHGAAFIFPGSRPGLFPPPGFLGHAQGIDPYLPCHSRFFSQRQQAEASSGTGGQPASADGQPNQALAEVLSGIISSLINQIPGSAGVAQVEVHTSSVNQGSTASTRSTASVATSTQSSAANVGARPRPQVSSLAELRDILQTARNISSTAASQSGTTTTATSQSGRSGDQRRPMGEEMIARLISGIGSSFSQVAMGHQPSETLYDFASSLGQDYAGSGEGLLTDIFVCISRHLTIVDLMSIFCHQVEPLQRLVRPLQEFVNERVLHGKEATDENIDSSMEQLIEEILPQIEEICTDAPVQDNIDFPASVQELLRHHFRVNVHLIVRASEGDSGFADELYRNLRLLFHEFLALSQFCLEGGQQAVERMVQANVSRIFADVSPLIQQWMASMSIQQVQSIMRGIQVKEDQVQCYVVRRTDMDVGGQSLSSDASFASAESGDREQDLAEQHEPPAAATVAEMPECKAEEKESNAMEVDTSTVSSIDRTPVSSSDRTPQISPELLQCLPPPPQATDNIPVVVGSESWHSQVPPDWVEVITQDAHRQQHLPVQPPFSDAYINGMPAKRRKLMSRGPEDVRDLADVRTLLPQAIRRAAASAGAQPITSEEDMQKDATSSATLREAFQQEMNDSIRKRLQRDADYIPEKYPNIEKYYHNKK